jgi:1,4-dihydroxy-2-naphthoate octaprenyltransferase
MEKCHYLHREGDNTTGEGESPKATVSQLGWAIVGFLAFAALMGGIALVTQWLLHGWQAAMGIVLYAVLGLVVGINYSGKPLELGFHGLGELVIGLMFGPLCMLGIQAAMTGHIFSWEMACISIAIGCLVTNIVYVHSVMEVDADAQLGKMTFARLLFEGPKRKGKEDKGKKRMIIYIGVFAIMPFALLGLGIVLGWWSPWYLMTLLTLPMSIFLIHSTRLFAYGLPRNDKPRWWMGPMGEWDKYVKAGMDWFLFRWLLARNICTFFCLILIIVHLLN